MANGKMKIIPDNGAQIENQYETDTRQRGKRHKQKKFFNYNQIIN